MRVSCRALFSAAAALLLCTGYARGQMAPANVPPRLPEVSSDVERQLAQVDALVEAKAWDEAVDAVLRVQQASGDRAARLVKVSPRLYVPLADACGGRIAAWPPEGLAAYRSRVDATARSHYEQGVAARSVETLQRVADEYFASSWGDDALWRIGELQLERGNFDQARRCWMRLAPGLVARDGRPWGIALVGADLNDEQLWRRVAEQIATPRAASDRGTFPDTNVPLAEIFARLAMVSIRERNFPRAEAELAIVKRLYPESEGTIAGRHAPLWQLVEGTLRAARQWPEVASPSGWSTFAGSDRRNHQAAPLGDLRGVVWEQPAMLDVRNSQMSQRVVIQGNRLITIPGSGSSIPEPVGNSEALVVFNGGSTLSALRVATGEPLFGDSGTIYEENTLFREGRGRVTEFQLQPNRVAPRGIVGDFQLNINGRIVVNNRLIGPTRQVQSVQASMRPRLLTLAGSTVFATLSSTRVTNQPTLGQNLQQRLAAFDLAAEGKLRLTIDLQEEGLRFSGPPVVAEETIYVPLRQSTSGEEIYVAAYSRETGRPLWRTSIGSTIGDNYAPDADLLTHAEGNLYFNTNAGVITALRATDGQVLWARTYELRPAISPDHPPRPATPCLYAAGLLICMPSDSPGLFALDGASGAVVWLNPAPSDITDLLAVVDGRLIATGGRLWMIDAMTGRSEFVWPDSPAGGIEGGGRGCVAGNEIFWPTREALFTIDVKTGSQTRPPIPLEGLGGSGANVTPLGKYLVVTTSSKLSVLGPDTPPTPPAEQAQPLPPQPTTARIDRGLR